MGDSSSDSKARNAKTGDQMLFSQKLPLCAQKMVKHFAAKISSSQLYVSNFSKKEIRFESASAAKIYDKETWDVMKYLIAEGSGGESTQIEAIFAVMSFCAVTLVSGRLVKEPWLRGGSSNIYES